MAGQATYCAVKAGMDHLSRAVALDQALLANGARIVSLAPGVIDTDMQAQLRGSSVAGFPERKMFVELKETGRLSSSHEAAARVLAWLGAPRLRHRAGGRRPRSLRSRNGRGRRRARISRLTATYGARSTRLRRPPCHDSRLPPSPRPRSWPLARRCRRPRAGDRRSGAGRGGARPDRRLDRGQRAAEGPGHSADPGRPRTRGGALRRLPRPWLRRLASGPARDAGLASQGRGQHGADPSPRLAARRARAAHRFRRPRRARRRTSR